MTIYKWRITLILLSVTKSQFNHIMEAKTLFEA